MNHGVKQTQGFTLIELMLAMSFIAVLLLAIAMTIIQIGTIYNKGVNVKDINQVGRSVASDLTRTAHSAASLNLATDLRTSTTGGRLCFGNYSYIWNYATALEANDPALTKYESSTKTIRLAKVPDSAKIYCSLNATMAYTYKSIRAADTARTQELLPEGDHRLNVTQFKLLSDTAVTDPTTQQAIYTVLYTLGSGDVKAMNSDQSACLPPSSPNADPVYCTVQPFTLVLRTGNRG